MVFYLLTVQPPPELNFGMMFLRMLIFLGLVLVLIYFVLRKGLPLLMQTQGFRNKTIKIMERVPIDQKRSLLVVEIQGKVYLLGSAEGQINLLMELDRDKLAKEPETVKRNFADVLKKKVEANS